MLWVGAAVAGLAAVVPQLDHAVSADRAESVEGYSIPRGPDGQFYVDGKVGEVAVRFLVDPNAEEVVISGDDAARLGLSGSQISLPSIAVGPTAGQAISARIAPAMPVSLLGRAYLSRLAVAQVQGDRLVLR